MTAAAIRSRNRVTSDRQGRCQIAAQALVRGFQELRVTAQNERATGRGHGVISVRVGMVLLELQDREALFSWIAAIQRAIELQDGAFGVETPTGRHEPEGLARKAS